MKLILGTSSSARIKLFSKLTTGFIAVSSDFDERSIAHQNQDPKNYCRLLAEEKNKALQDRYPDHFIITCDTIVYLNQILNKPEDYQDAFNMLKLLSGSKHQVLSGACVSFNGHMESSIEITDVEFNTLTDEMIEIFLKDPQFINRSGAYTISGKGAMLIKKIDGSYDNVIGLPINCIEQLLSRFGESLWSLTS